MTSLAAAASELTPLITTVATVLLGLVTAALTFRRGRDLYDNELGGLEIKFKNAGEAAKRVDTVVSSGRVERLEADLERIGVVSDGMDPVRSEDLVRHIEELVRKETGAVARAAQDRSQAILTDEYHAQGLAQSKIAFLFSLVFASLGFLLIAASVVAVLTGADVGAGVVTLVSGAVVEAVSALFFVQANRARTLMVEFFDKLRIDRSLDESLRLSQTIPDPLIRSRVQTILAIRLAQAQATDGVLHAVMSTGAGPSVVREPADALGDPATPPTQT